MRGQVAAILIVLALIVGAGLGYLGNSTTNNTTTVTKTYTYTITTTFSQGGSAVMRCVLTQYAVWEIAHIQNSTITSYGNSTETINLKTYETSASVTQSVGYVTTSTSSYTGTITGALAEGNYTTCTYISR
jgi:hypothetical protein